MLLNSFKTTKNYKNMKKLFDDSSIEKYLEFMKEKKIRTDYKQKTIKFSCNKCQFSTNSKFNYERQLLASKSFSLTVS